jgi:hypothetical protein
MRQAMQQERVEAGVTQENLQNAARRGVAAEDGVDLFTNGREQTGSSPK